MNRFIGSVYNSIQNSTDNKPVRRFLVCVIATKECIRKYFKKQCLKNKNIVFDYYYYYFSKRVRTFVSKIVFEKKIQNCFRKNN